MHLLANGLTCIPQEAWLHPELRLHLPAIERMARALENGKQEPSALTPELDGPGIKALSWINDHTIKPGVFRLPYLSPEYCDLLIVEAEKMGAELGYEPNELEEEAYQIPELFLRNLCMPLFNGLDILQERVIHPFSHIMYGQAAKCTRSIQFALYEPNGTSHGNWHHDLDSDITTVVSLNPEGFTGGGTDLRTGPMASIRVDKLDKGHALIFPGKQTLHRGRAVESGKRHLLVHWSEFK